MRPLKGPLLSIGLILMQLFLPLPAQAEPVPVTGTIQSIAESENGQLTLTLENEGGTTTFLVDRNTVVQMMSPAKQLKKGRRVLGNLGEKRGGGGERKGTKMPFQNMPGMQKKMLGLPDLPPMPEMPEVPDIPKSPKVPKAPKPVKGKTGGEAVGKSASPEAGEQGQAGVSEEGSSEPDAQKVRKSVQPKEVTPEKDTLAKLIPDKPLFEAGSASTFEVKQVVNLKKTPKGIEIELKGSKGASEKFVVSPDDAFVELLDVKELKQGMKVSANLTQAGDGSVAQQITVL